MAKTPIGTEPCRLRAPSVFLALGTAVRIVPIAMLALTLLTPPFDSGWPNAERLWGVELLSYLGDRWVDRSLYLRLAFALLCAFAGGLVASRLAWRNTPLTDGDVTMPHADEPRLHRDAYASRAMMKRLRESYGATAKPGLWLAPGVRLPREAEGQFMLVLGDKGSGKSNILRAFASQAVARGDRVLLHCVKGDVARSFASDEAVLIGAHHKHGWAWDAAADLDGEAAYMDLAAAVIPSSGSSAFWAQSARAVFVDILHDLATEPGRKGWTFTELAERLLDDPESIRARIARLGFSSSPLIESGEDGLTNTAFGIMATLWAGTLSGLRPLALAWDGMPPERRFSVKRWLKGEGPGVVVLQTTPEYAELSTLVATSVLGRVVVGVSDPSLPVDPKRRVTLVLDEFHALGRIRRLETALALGREKGLVVTAALQSLAQLPAVYGPKLGPVVQDLFRIRIVSALAAGPSAEQVSNLIGRRTLVWRELNNDPDKKGPYRDERGERPLVSTTALTRDLGIRMIGTDPKNPDHKRVRAVISGLGDAYQLDWPLTFWPKKREGYVPASWLKASRRRVEEGKTETLPGRGEQPSADPK